MGPKPAGSMHSQWKSRGFDEVVCVMGRGGEAMKTRRTGKAVVGKAAVKQRGWGLTTNQ